MSIYHMKLMPYLSPYHHVSYLFSITSSPWPQIGNTIKIWENTSMHVVDHVYKWHRCRTLCKITIQVLEFLLDWFLNSLLPMIAKDVATNMPRLEDEDIFKVQHFDLIYAQSRYLYTFIPGASRYHSLDQASLKISHLYRWNHWGCFPLREWS